MASTSSDAIDTAIVVPETAGSALYGMIDVLCAAGNLWQPLVRTAAGTSAFGVRIVSTTCARFACGNGIPVEPDADVASAPALAPALVIVPESGSGRTSRCAVGIHP